MGPSLLATLVLAASPFPGTHAVDPTLRLSDKGYFETRGLYILAVNAAIDLVKPGR